MLQYSLEQTHQCRLLDAAYLILTQVKTSCILNENEYYEVLTGSRKTTKTAASVRSQAFLRIWWNSGHPLVRKRSTWIPIQHKVLPTILRRLRPLEAYPEVPRLVTHYGVDWPELLGHLDMRQWYQMTAVKSEKNVLENFSVVCQGFFSACDSGVTSKSWGRKEWSIQSCRAHGQIETGFLD